MAHVNEHTRRTKSGGVTTVSEHEDNRHARNLSDKALSATDHAKKNPSMVNHLKAAMSHAQASAAHRKTGNHDIADRHDKMANNHGLAADSMAEK